MYQPAAFQETRPAELHALIAAHPLATVMRAGRDGPLADHLPLRLDATRGPCGVLRGHVARANPLWREALDAPVDTLVIFQAPSAYVSPTWYPSKAATHKVVPTYNYSVVHARGRLRAIDDPAWLRELVGELTRHFEAGRDAPWQVTDAPADYIDAMLRAIVGIEVELVSLVGKFKLSQNRSADDRAGAIAGLRREADAQAHAVAAAMQRAGGG